jgi:hypothetical protein
MSTRQSSVQDSRIFMSATTSLEIGGITTEPRNLLTAVRDEAKILDGKSPRRVLLPGDTSYASLALNSSGRFHVERFEESLWDDSAHMLLGGAMFLKCQRNMAGNQVWTLEHGVERQQSNGTHFVTSREVIGTPDIIAFLNEYFQTKSNWIPLTDEEDLCFRFPCLLVMYYCVRIDSMEWCEGPECAYFEHIQIAPGVFYSLATYSFNTPSEIPNGDQTSNEDVLSKALATLYHHNLPLFKTYFTAPAISPLFQNTTPLTIQFGEMARQFSSLDESYW